FDDECVGGSAVTGGVGEPGANAHQCRWVTDGPKCVAIDRWWCGGLGARTRGCESSESFADRLGRFGVARNAEFEPAVGAQR
ncbi:MAG: hypothetical protein ACKOQO_03040, partial [Candidatus Limnocylindrus sp.]